MLTPSRYSSKPDLKAVSKNSQGKPEVAGAIIVAFGSDWRMDLAVAPARPAYCCAFGSGLQKWMLGSFQISQMTWRPRKCIAACAAQRAKAAMLSGCCGEAVLRR